MYPGGWFKAAWCLLACLAVPGCARRASEQVNWRRWAPPGGGYAVWLPGKLEYVPSSEGLANWGTVVGGDTEFLTSYVDVPGAAGQSARQRLTAAARQASRQGRVLSQRRLKQGRLEGLEVVVEDD
ncbi:MAG: hypothetical protein K6T86_19340, partial [Pirellulales bacterium]|nr:hypothetical protein [Pirellulales bacterium]